MHAEIRLGRGGRIRDVQARDRNFGPSQVKVFPAGQIRLGNVVVFFHVRIGEVNSNVSTEYSFLPSRRFSSPLDYCHPVKKFAFMLLRALLRENSGIADPKCTCDPCYCLPSKMPNPAKGEKYLGRNNYDDCNQKY